VIDRQRPVCLQGLADRPAQHDPAGTAMPQRGRHDLLDLGALEPVWRELFPAQQARIVQLLVERIDVQEDALEVRIRTEGLASLIGELRQHEERRAA
jgi:hypothetical protein